ncbi:DNA mismatch repair protein MutT [Propionigenium maris DSM 9537]|uniref:DNA mismatch repair protein MutT n=1 Tax=Propionigenium maris DSM 9537 TaxID=1123000 RepID=A0A9W6LN72_9FUSO|nr:NUDIX hydrolase [Propionigenium maris]GLI56599.1 DNA mismatch repair protein MutT [Propionigenium maris DSM 9537]
MKYKHLTKRRLFQNEHLEVFQEELQLPHGQRVWWSFFKGMSAAAVIAINEKDEIILVNQYRPAVKDHILEIPAGLVEEGEDPEVGARRELEEETGYRAGKLTKLYEYYTSPGISSSKMYIYLATDLTNGKQKLDEDEYLEIVHVPVNDLKPEELKDGKTLLAYSYLMSMRRK